MEEWDVFVSVGGTFTSEQESFIRAVEDRLRGENMIPHTVGRNTFSSDAPLKTVTTLMEKCSGTVVVALERMYFSNGIDKRGGGNDEKQLVDIKLPTAWNQIEAALSYAHNLPLLVIIEDGLKNEGLLERGYDWYVQSVSTEISSLNSLEFNGVFASWKQKVKERNIESPSTKLANPQLNIDELTIGKLVSGLKPSQLWSVVVVISSIVAGAFILGFKLPIGG